MIKTLTHRAYKHCSDWVSFDVEIKRIIQNLINNKFPQKFIENTINKHITKLYEKKQKDTKLEKTKFYLQSYSPKNMKNDQKSINKIINEHITSINKEKEIEVTLYYKPKKIESCFTTRTKTPETDKHNVVYQFSCPEDSCNASYIGYTTNTLLTRAKQHKYAPSKINKHYSEDHQKTPDNSILQSFKVLYQDSDEINVRIGEAIYIKNFKPKINVKYNEISNFLKIF